MECTYVLLSTVCINFGLLSFSMNISVCLSIYMLIEEIDKRQMVINCQKCQNKKRHRLFDTQIKKCIDDVFKV